MRQLPSQGLKQGTAEASKPYIDNLYMRRNQCGQKYQNFKLECLQPCMV